MPVKRKGLSKGLKSRMAGVVEKGLEISARLIGDSVNRMSKGKVRVVYGRPYKSGDGRWRIDIGTFMVLRYPAYPIVAKNARALAFEWPNAPPEVIATQRLWPLVFFYRVTHPGQRVKIKDLLRMALQRNRRPVVRHIGKQIKKVN